MTKHRAIPQHHLDAVDDHLAGLSRRDASLKYGIHESTLTRAMKILGLRLSPEEIQSRKKIGGRTHGPPGTAFKSQKCPPSCNCARHNRGRKVEIIMGRKNCTRCMRWRYLLDFQVRERDENDEPIAWQSNCKVCQREIQRVSKGIKRRGRPYEPRRPAMTHEEKLVHRRNLYHEKLKDKEWLALRREYSRIYAEAKRRERGVQPRNFANKTLPGYGELLPIEPIAHWVKLKLNNGYKGNRTDLANMCKVDEAVIRRIYRQENDEISEDLVDHILTHEGTTDLWQVYPHLYV